MFFMKTYHIVFRLGLEGSLSEWEMKNNLRVATVHNKLDTEGKTI
jgi:hypothetical protein